MTISTISIVTIFNENKPVYLVYENGMLLYTCVNLEMLSSCLHEYQSKAKLKDFGLGLDD